VEVVGSSQVAESKGQNEYFKFKKLILIEDILYCFISHNKTKNHKLQHNLRPYTRDSQFCIK